MHFRSVEDRVNRYAADGRGYLRVRGQTVLAARAVYTTADRPLPAYERLLLGGSSSVRGFETGAFDGDRTLAASIELRHPVTSVLSGSKLGVNLFFDAGRAWDAGGRFEDAAWRRGAGAGLFLIASVVRINLDVAHGFRTGDTRVHLSSGFTF
jgi:outer membrane protein insertion porin family